MCKNKTLPLLVLLFLSFNLAFAQTGGDSRVNEYYEKVPLSKIDANVLGSISQIVSNSNSNTSEIFKVLVKSKILHTILNSFIEGNKKMPDAILFFNGINGINDWLIFDTTFHPIGKLIYGTSLAVICIDNFSNVDYQVNVNIEPLTPYLETEAKAIVSLVTSLFTPAKSVGRLGAITVPSKEEFYVKCDISNNIPYPSNINVLIQQLSTFDLKENKIPDLGKMENILAITDSKVYFANKNEVKIKNVERRYFGFSIGVSYAESNTTLIAPDPSLSDLNILKVQKGVGKQWKGNAILIFSLYPGVETDYTPDNKFWHINEFLSDFPKRLSLNFGFSINDQPFDRLYLGLGIRINEIVDLIVGYNFTNLPEENSTISLLKVSSLNDVSKLFPTKYQSGKFVGLSIRILDLLNVL